MATRPRDTARLHVTLLSPDGTRAAARGLGPWLARVAPRRARGEVTVALVSDGRMRSLNRTFRGMDHATDVLSFPVVAEATAGQPAASTKASPPGPIAGAPHHARSAAASARGSAALPLGDIAIATGVAARQARGAGHTLGTELRVLALHGLLHLLGFDHDDDDGRMARTETRLRRVGQLPAGLIARAGRPRLPATPATTRVRARR
jgi:probable rRNA maturation factor